VQCLLFLLETVNVGEVLETEAGNSVAVGDRAAVMEAREDSIAAAVAAEAVVAEEVAAVAAVVEAADRAGHKARSCGFRNPQRVATSQSLFGQDSPMGLGRK
jgi:serine acetyltransferase